MATKRQPPKATRAAAPPSTPDAVAVSTRGERSRRGPRTLTDAARLAVRRACKQEFENGVPVRKIADTHQLSPERVASWAKDEGWARPSGYKVPHSPAAKRRDGTQAPVIPPVATGIKQALLLHDRPGIVDLEEVARLTAHDVVLSQRFDLAVARGILQQLVGELRATQQLSENLLLVQQVLTEGQTDPKQLEQARETIARILSLPSRAQTMRALTETMQRIHDGERRALGLKDGDVPGRVTLGEDGSPLPDEVVFRYSPRTPDGEDLSVDDVLALESPKADSRPRRFDD